MSKWQNGKYEGQYKGIYVIARVKGDLGKYYAVFCFTPNGKKYLTTVVKESDGGIYKKEIEDKTATVLSDYSSAETDGLASSSISTDIIQKKLAKRNNDTNEPYHQMAGEHAATAMVGRLQSAETMERNGTSPEEIWKETGWMRGPDHKWRFEIPDNLDKIHFPKDRDAHTLGRIYDNPALYEAYPELAQKTVRMKDTKSGKDKRTRGAYGYVAEDGSIAIDSSLPADEAKTALVHEIQHSIQAIEGFSRGGNKEMAKKYISDTIDRLSMDLMDMEFKDPKAKEYMDMAEEIADSFNETDVIGSLTKIKDLTEKRKKLLESLPEGERKELSTIERDLNLLEDPMKQDDYAAYRRLGGEAETFMAEDRARNPSKSMLDYNTPYGPAVINYAGGSLLFRMAEPDLVVTHNITEDKLADDKKAFAASIDEFQKGKMVVALDLKNKDDAHIVATFALDQSSNEVYGTHAYQLSFLTSVYVKDNNDKENPTPRDNWFLEQLEKGNLKYINRKKLQDFYGTDERLLARSSEKISELQSALIIRDENDLVKLKNRHPNFYQMAGERTKTSMISRAAEG